MGKVKRKQNIREVIPTILIVTEGKTEYNYFMRFNVSTLTCRLDIHGASCCTTAVVKKAVDLSSQINYDIVWCVFDFDDFDSFDKAILQAYRNGFKVAYSNECFEYWFLLHFSYLSSALKRDMYKEKLDKHFDGNYDKLSVDIYDRLISNQTIAIRNAKRIEKLHDDTLVNSNVPSKRKPSTKVYELVEFLNQYIKK